MKIGDQLPVEMQGLQVGVGIIEDISDGKATIVIPATRVQFAIRSSLAPIEGERQEILLDGNIEHTDTTSDAIESHNASSHSEGLDNASGTGGQEEPTSLSDVASNALEDGTKSLRDMDFDTSALDKE